MPNKDGTGPDGSGCCKGQRRNNCRRNGQGRGRQAGQGQQTGQGNSQKDTTTNTTT